MADSRLPLDMWSVILNDVPAASICRLRMTGFSFFHRDSFTKNKEAQKRIGDMSIVGMDVDLQNQVFFLDGCGGRWINKKYQPASTSIWTLQKQKQQKHADLLQSAILPANEKIVRVYSGKCINSKHTDPIFCITETGLVYSYGENVYGELGLGFTSPLPFRNVAHPRRITAFNFNANEIRHIFSGNSKTYFVLNKGVRACGLNAHGELGVNIKDQNAISVPVTITALQDLTVEQVFICENKVFFTTLDQTFGCGDNRHGQLGNGKIGTLCYVPTEITALNGHQIKQIEASLHRTLFLTMDGLLFACGGKAPHQNATPVQIAVGAPKIKQIMLVKGDRILLVNELGQVLTYHDDQNKPLDTQSSALHEEKFYADLVKDHRLDMLIKYKLTLDMILVEACNKQPSIRQYQFKQLFFDIMQNPVLRSQVLDYSSNEINLFISNALKQSNVKFDEEFLQNLEKSIQQNKPTFKV